MTQYDAGPGDWSDRPWEDPDRKTKPQARRRRVALPPWALLAILIAVIILLCFGLVMLIRAIRNGGEEGTPTPEATATEVEAAPTSTAGLVAPTEPITMTPTATVVIPLGSPTAAPVFSEIAPGATVVVKGTLGAGLNLRADPTVQGRRVANYRDGAELSVVDGPQEADGYVWWLLRAGDGTEGWGAAAWLELKTE